MIKITIDLLPYGKSRGKTTLAKGFIINDLTGTLDLGNYEYELLDGVVIYKKGKVKGFKRRKKNVWELLKFILKEV